MYSTTTTTTNTTTTTTTTSTASTNTTPLSPAPRTPSISSYEPRALPENNAYIKEALKDLRTDIAVLPDTNTPDFPTLLRICGEFKNNAANLEQAQRQPSLASELYLLCHQLPKLFAQIHRCLEAQTQSKTALDVDSLATLCMGLSTLAPPLTGSLLTEAQRETCQPILTTISAKLAANLSNQFIHGYADTGALLNCLNWFSRAIKADLVQKNQSAIQATFQSALNQMQAWSATSTQPTNLNSRQFCKCMVQLNTMIKQRLISIDPGKTSGQANRATWAATVQNLCSHFLSKGAWLYDCKLVEVINITNTLKDGLELGLLSSSDNAWAPVFSILAQRISKQEFDLKLPSSLTGMGNCANFLRSLFEHNLLGTIESATGKAVLHLVSQLGCSTIASGLNSNSAQALVNLASFIKATDRWLAIQPKPAQAGSHATLAQASETLIDALSVLLADNPNPSWMRMPQTCSALLAALQHLWQRGLVRAEQRNLLEPIFKQLLQSIPNWKQAAHNSPSTLQSLRALVSLVKGSSPVANLESTPVFAEALATLIGKLQQSKLTLYTDEERLASLQAIQISVVLGTIALNVFQPLLQSLLQTKDEVDLQQLETAINNFGGLVTRLEALNAEALSQAAAIIHATTLESKQAKPRGKTYRGTAPQPINHQRIVDKQPAFGSDDWKTVDKGNKSPLLLVEPTLSSTSPKVISRYAEQSKGNKQNETETKKTALMTSLPPSQVEKAQPTKIKQAQQGLSLYQAQTTWFTLLRGSQGISLQRLQELALAHPQLLNMKAPGKQGQVALFYALIQGKKDIVEWLMKQVPHALPESLGKFLITALNQIETIEKRHVAGMRTFIDAYLKQKLGDQKLNKQEIIAKKNALLQAEEKVELILFPALRSLFEETKLIMKEDLSAAALAKVGEKGKIKNKTTIDPVQLRIEISDAIQSGDITALKIALKNIENIQQNGFNDVMFDLIRFSWLMLMTTPHVGDIEWVKALLGTVKDKDALLKIPNIDGFTILNLAAYSGHLDIVKAILNEVSDKDALVKIPNIGGWTALNSAAYGGHLKVVNVILGAVRDKEALVKIPNLEGGTALSSSAEQGYVDIVNAILNVVTDKDALVKIPNIDGWTALNSAADSGHHQVVKVILNAVRDKDALVKIPNIAGWTALSSAADGGHLDIVKAILSAVRDKDSLVKIPNIEGYTALHSAAALGYVDIVKAILNAASDKKALTQIQANDGSSALDFAISNGHVNAAITIRDALENKKALVRVENNDVALALNPLSLTEQTTIVPMNLVNDNAATQIKKKDE